MGTVHVQPCRESEDHFLCRKYPPGVPKKYRDACVGFPTERVDILAGREEIPVSCKFTLLLKKRQAETYRSHGLHKEALAIYNNLLNTTQDIDPDLERFIQSKIQEIEADMADFSSRREGAFTAQDINRLMQGWSENAGSADRLVGVQALCSVGSYDDALAELKKLVHQDGVKEAYMDPLVDCLMNLYIPDRLPAAVDEFASGCLPKDASISLPLSLAEKMSGRSDGQRAAALYRHLRARNDLTGETTARIDAALEKLATAAAAPPPPPAPETTSPDSPPMHDSVIRPFTFSALRAFLKGFNERCRSLLASMR
jgi:hypothetical protein